MMAVVALLCSISLAPADCDRTSALDAIPLGTAETAIECMMSAQMTLAALAIRADAEHRWVVKCEPPTSIGKGDRA